jgi:thymidine kinase
MDCGKSTLALQIHHNHSRQGRRGLVLTRLDRSLRPQVTTRIGLSATAIEVEPHLDLTALVRSQPRAHRLRDLRRGVLLHRRPDRAAGRPGR